eukprot:12515439-Prorocentrum_lima.AAC.1
MLELAATKSCSFAVSGNLFLAMALRQRVLRANGRSQIPWLAGQRQSCLYAVRAWLAQHPPVQDLPSRSLI